MVVLALVCSLDAPLWLVTVVAAVSSTLARIQAAAVMSLAADIVVESELARAARLAAAAEAVATADRRGRRIAVAGPVLRRRASSWSMPSRSCVSALLIASVRSGAARAAPSCPERRPTSVIRRGSRGWRCSGRCRRRGRSPRTSTASTSSSSPWSPAVSSPSGSGAGGYGWLLAATGLGGLVAVTPLRRSISRILDRAAARVGLVAYAVPLMFFALGSARGRGDRHPGPARRGQRPRDLRRDHRAAACRCRRRWPAGSSAPRSPWCCSVPAPAPSALRCCWG